MRAPGSPSFRSVRSNHHAPSCVAEENVKFSCTLMPFLEGASKADSSAPDVSTPCAVPHAAGILLFLSVSASDCAPWDAADNR